nr:glucosamine-6-phosphate deaminase [Gloeothece verrucosa]
MKATQKLTGIKSMVTQAFNIDALCLCLCPSSKSLAHAAAQSVIQYLQQILSQQQTATLVLATGNSQIELLDILAATAEIDWSRIILFHLDEFLGIEAHESASFRYFLQERLLKQINPQHFYGIQGEAAEPLAECDRYTHLLTQHPIDLCFLGIGHNGHLAFNEPGVANFNDPYRVKIVKLAQQTRLTGVEQGYFPSLARVPQYAYTLTLSTILEAKKIVCLAFGKSKAKIVKEMLTGTINSSCPASGLRLHPHTTLFLDRDAASELDLSVFGKE